MLFKSILIILSLSGANKAVEAFEIGQKIKLDNIRLDYSRPSGRIIADQLRLDLPDVGLSFEQLDGTIEILDNKLVLAIDLFKFYLNQSDLNNLEFAKIENLNLEHDAHLLALSFDQVLLPAMSLQNAFARCLSPNQAISSIIDLCIKSGQVNLEQLNLSATSRTQDFFQNFMQEVLEQIDPQYSLSARNIEKIENIKLKISEGNFTLNAKADFVINVKMTIEGLAIHLPNEKVIKLEIQKAKAGIINVKKKLLDELKSANIPNIQVQGDNIYWSY
jgi:hypothetical protein